ncbi:uncharacterized protein LOC124366290 [Homalodisca vitripennis]|uniref:uncharacterized protein LOC124366290 n=1 Tax=Homalodisca vitripennis TaxID=197043 RepID=UPI001EEA02AC|nr:uncharacterized protein LOC124366290 [Homalodisca vitripennis]
MGEEKDWHISAQEIQQKFYESLGSRPFDEIEKSNRFLLKKKVGFAICGRPVELPCRKNYNTGYNKEQLILIKTVCNKIVEKSEYNPIRFACTILVPYHKGIQPGIPIFRIVTASGNIFIDARARVYRNWNHFLEKNKLPDCQYCYPLDGEYSHEKGLVLGFAYSPASGVVNKAADYLDTAGSVVSVAAASVLAAGFFITVAPAVAAVAATSAACTGVYGVGRSVSSLYDRNKHEQSIGLKDRESRSAWLSIGSSALGATTVAAVGKAQTIVEGGKSIGRFGTYGLHALTATSVAFTGYGFVDAAIICADKYKRGKLTKKDVFDMSCELLFLFNAVASSKATVRLIDDMSETANDALSDTKLTKTQRRNLKKREAKRITKALQMASLEDADQSSGPRISLLLQPLLSEAIIAYAPRAEEILYKCHSIGHDMMSWKMKEISDDKLLMSTCNNMEMLYNDHEIEVEEANMKVLKYFRSSATDRKKREVIKFYNNSSKELKSIFCTKIINMEDRVEAMMNDAERDIIDLQERLQIENDKSISENIAVYYEEELNPETQSLLNACIDIMFASPQFCSGLHDFCELLDKVTSKVVKAFKAEMATYIASLEPTESSSKSLFYADLFNRTHGIREEVVDCIFSKILQDVKSTITVDGRRKEAVSEISARITALWEGLTEGLYVYYGAHGAGRLTRIEILHVINSVTNMAIQENNIRLLENEDEDVVIIEVKASDVYIAVYCGITEEFDSSGVILIVK